MNSIKATPRWLVRFVVVCCCSLLLFAVVGRCRWLVVGRLLVGCRAGDLLWGWSKANTNSKWAEQKATTAKMLPISVTKSSETVKKLAAQCTRLQDTISVANKVQGNLLYITFLFTYKTPAQSLIYVAWRHLELRRTFSTYRFLLAILTLIKYTLSWPFLMGIGYNNGHKRSR